MADAAPVVHIGENSPEQIAFRLMELVAQSEKKRLRHAPGQAADAGRKWILDTYAKCLEAVSGDRANGSIWEALGRDS